MISRTTGYPFTSDRPFATPLGDWRFRVQAVRGTAIGEGDVDEVIAMLISNLPRDCSPAIESTAEDVHPES